MEGNSNSAILDIDIAGIPVRLNFRDLQSSSELCQLFPKDHPASAGPFNHDEIQHSTSRPPLFFLEVQVSEPKQRTFDSSSEILDGHGEYKGLLDIENSRGTVSLTSAFPVNALMNCLRQVYTRLIVANDGLVIHAACVVRNSNAYIFSGRSGTGKSTVCELSPDYMIASDDLTAVRKINGHFLAWGMPGFETRGPSSTVQRQPLPIKAFFRLAHDTKNHLNLLPGAKAVADILALPSCPIEPETIGKMLEVLENLTDHIPCYELRFKRDPSFWKLIEKEFAS